MTLRGQFFAAMLLVSGCVGISIVMFSSFVTGAALHGHDAAERGEPPGLSAPLRDEVASLQRALTSNGLSASTSLRLAPGLESWDVAVVARSGTIVASSQRRFIGMRVTRRSTMVAIQSSRQASSKRRTTYAQIAEHLLREAPLHDRRGNLVATAMFMPTTTGILDLLASRTQDRLNRLFWLGGLVALLASALASAFLAAQLAKPLRGIIRAAGRMADGDLSSRAPVMKSSAELRELALAFNAMAGRLERAERLRSEMSSDIAHELRTPLNNLHGQLEAIEADVMVASADRIGSLKEETRRLAELVSDLQQLTVADDAGARIHPEPVSPAEFLRVLIQKFDGLAVKSGVSLVADCPDDVPLVLADVRSLRHIFVNLIGNAVRHAPQHGRVVVAARGAEAHVRFSVTDDGPGIPVEYLDDVFERFFRTDTARSRDSGGSGLGLAIAKKLVEAHHGSITAENIPGSGARISFSIPRYAEDVRDCG